MSHCNAHGSCCFDFVDKKKGLSNVGCCAFAHISNICKDSGSLGTQGRHINMLEQSINCGNSHSVNISPVLWSVWFLSLFFAIPMGNQRKKDDNNGLNMPSLDRTLQQRQALSGNLYFGSTSTARFAQLTGCVVHCYSFPIMISVFCLHLLFPWKIGCKNSFNISEKESGQEQCSSCHRKPFQQIRATDTGEEPNDIRTG